LLLLLLLLLILFHGGFDLVFSPWIGTTNAASNNLSPYQKDFIAWIFWTFHE
jgi:hypothetical protein